MATHDINCALLVHNRRCNCPVGLPCCERHVETGERACGREDHCCEKCPACPWRTK